MTDSDPAPPVTPPARTYRLALGRWACGYGGYSPSLNWTEVTGLDVPERGPLEEWATHALKMPGVVAVRIVVYENGREVQDVAPGPY